MTATLTGYFSLATRMRSEGSLSEFDFNGIKRFGARERQFAMTLALAAYVPEGFLFEVMKDARVARRQEHLHTTLWDEYSFLSQLPTDVWETLSAAVEMPVFDLRARVLAAASISWSFIEWRVLRVAARLPWRLCAGDVDRNLDDLLSGECPDEPVSAKLWALGNSGYNKHRLRRVLHLLAERSWSSAFSEKQHASASRIKKHHPDIGDNMLIARSYVYTFCELLPIVAEQQKHRRKLVEELTEVQRKKPSNITGRQLYLAYVMQKAASLDEPGQRRSYKRQRIMALHGEAWQKLSLQAKARYDAQAELSRADAHRKKFQEEGRLQKELAEHDAMAAAGMSQRDGAIQISSCRLTAADVQRLDELRQAKAHNVSHTRDARAKVLQCPRPVCDEQSRRHLELSELNAPRDPEIPALARDICRMRDLFREAVFLVDGRWYRFLFAMLNPVQLCEKGGRSCRRRASGSLPVAIICGATGDTAHIG